MVSKKMQLCSEGLLVVCPFLFLLMKSFIVFYMGEVPQLNPGPPVYDLSILPCKKKKASLFTHISPSEECPQQNVYFSSGSWSEIV